MEFGHNGIDDYSFRTLQDEYIYNSLPLTAEGKLEFIKGLMELELGKKDVKTDNKETENKPKEEVNITTDNK